ncbi:hypothetical protein N7468_003062 [Penicillium chermesinum]|uniref:Arrestin-like N-terminal domain-containing protein n=1 Tax=Penicillium chermesinum TaxID=63820 RepID=A0A9W9P5R4_9EURO|nr:uncharacterized protein N7468_003062 [Penicillium chermesinum]KAJ5238443.1 hypothetical protein N7468_003062 [Penicillium chermesinum]
MPQHTRRGNDDFKFDLAAPAGWSYAPGDTIIGNLMRKTPIVTPDATIVFSFEGRSEVKITQPSRNISRNTSRNTSVYRDNWPICKSQPFTVHKGPLHLAPGSDEVLSWPFSLNIPLKPMATGPGSNIDPRRTFLPRDTSHPAHQTLPGSFAAASKSFMSDRESLDFVEYYLTAHLRYMHGGSYQTCEAIYPISIRQSMPSVHRLGVPVTVTSQRLISSQRLLPGMENAGLSFKQHAQRFFGSSKVPQFSCTFRLTVPVSIQLDDPTPLQVQLEIMPNLERSSDAIKDTAQNIAVLRLQVVLRSQTADRALSSAFGIEHSNSFDQTDRRDFPFSPPLVITTGKKSEPLHLGNQLQLILTSHGLQCGSQRTRQTPGPHPSFIYPDIITHNIRHTHTMDWRIDVKIAGETETERFSTRVHIIGPA